MGSRIRDDASDLKRGADSVSGFSPASQYVADISSRNAILGSPSFLATGCSAGIPENVADHVCVHGLIPLVFVVGLAVRAGRYSRWHGLEP